MLSTLNKDDVPESEWGFQGLYVACSFYKRSASAALLRTGFGCVRSWATCQQVIFHNVKNAAEATWISKHNDPNLCISSGDSIGPVTTLNFK